MPIVIFILVAFVGLADAAYLTASHYMGVHLSCSTISGCNAVALSEYSTIGPFPVALPGAIFYLFMLISGMAWMYDEKPAILKILPIFTIPAFLFSMWLVFVMLFRIEALCLYCLISAGSTTLLMVLSLWFYFKLKSIERDQEEG